MVTAEFWIPSENYGWDTAVHRLDRMTDRPAVQRSMVVPETQAPWSCLPAAIFLTDRKRDFQREDLIILQT